MSTDAKDAGPPPAAARPSSEMEGQVVSAERARLLSEANNYATTKSVTQIIFTTSAIASNVTLWNQLDHKAWRFGALNALIWTSVALNVFVILLATYLSFKRPPTDKDDAAKVGLEVKDLEAGDGGATTPLARHSIQRMHRSRVGQYAHGLGMLSVSPSEEQKRKFTEQKRRFMTVKSHLLNEVIGMLAVLIVIMNVIISAMAASNK